MNLDADGRWRERRHQKLGQTDNYELYRNTVITPRLMEEPGFTLTDEPRAKVRTAGVPLLNLTSGLAK